MITLCNFKSATSAALKFKNQKFSLKTLNFGGSKEVVYERADFPKDRLKKMFDGDTFAVIGYGTQVTPIPA